MRNYSYIWERLGRPCRTFKNEEKEGGHHRLGYRRRRGTEEPKVFVKRDYRGPKSKKKKGEKLEVGGTYPP